MPPPSGGLTLPDPILANVNKSKFFGQTIGFTDANLQHSMKGYGTAFVVQDQTQVLGKATTGAKVEGLATLLGSTLLGATARVDADAANATWSYANSHATVTSQTDNAKATCFVQVGSFTLLNETKAYSGDVISSPSFVKNYTKHLFDVSASYSPVWPIDVMVTVGADAGAVVNYSGTLDPLVYVLGNIGSKAKLSGSANGWVSASATFSVGAICANVGLQFDLRLANSGINGNVTADRSSVTGTIGLTEQPISMLLRIVWWGACVPDDHHDIWNWASSIYSVNYTL
ncbi:MAG TPA: hypothetical protein VM509_01245 [Planctomycetota bacterium]|nr:hypothetical protein [Planctomycetota bacterium]